jgi:hypothetical protein
MFDIDANYRDIAPERKRELKNLVQQMSTMLPHEVVREADYVMAWLNVSAGWRSCDFAEEISTGVPLRIVGGGSSG